MTIVDFHGNLNAAQQANQPGGVLQLGTPSNPVLPFEIVGVAVNYAYAIIQAWNGGNAIFQLDAFNDPALVISGGNVPMPIMMGWIDLSQAKSSGVSTYAWNQGTALPPACSAVKTVTDSLENPRQITFLFYQVNDLGTANPPVNAGAPATQALYAWYAFETTGGQTPSNSNLIGGTCIAEAITSDPCWGRGIGSENFWGDFLTFNSDGSIDSEGSVDQVMGSPTKPYLFLPTSSLGVLQMELNFGTAGVLGYGLRDGITGDSAPSSVY